MHLSCIKISIISKRTEMTFQLSLVTRCTTGYVQNDFWAYGTFGANRALVLSQDYYSLQMDQNKLSLEPHHQGVPSDVSKMIT
jgi:hypothetical protein